MNNASVHNQRQRWGHFKRSFQSDRERSRRWKASHLPPLPCLTFPSLAVMEDGLYQWIFRQCYCFSSPWTGAWTRGEYFYVSRNNCCTLLLLLDLMAQTRCCSWSSSTTWPASSGGREGPDQLKQEGAHDRHQLHDQHHEVRVTITSLFKRLRQCACDLTASSRDLRCCSIS